MPYLDHNATSPLRPEARTAMERAFAISGNPSSVHLNGRTARAAIEDAREKVAARVGARAQDMIFTSGGTEANTLALWGGVVGALQSDSRVTRIFVSAIEHPSVLKTAETIVERQAGIRLEIVPVTPHGVVNLDTLGRMLREGKGRALVAVMAANNETGVIQPVDAIAKLASECGALLLVDAVQALGKIAVRAECADYVSLSAHKIGGPQGVGALIVKGGAPFAPLLVGGGQERSRRAGTENVIGIAGFGGAADAAREEDVARLLALRDRFEVEVGKRFSGAVRFGADVPRLANTSNFAVPGIAAETTVMALDLDGVRVSSGAACSSGKVRPSHVLKAMGVSEEVAGSALRISFGWNSTESDVDAAIAALEMTYTRAKARRAA